MEEKEENKIMVHVTLNLPEKYIEIIGDLVKIKSFKSQSHALRMALTKLATKHARFNQDIELFKKKIGGLS